MYKFISASLILVSLYSCSGKQSTNPSQTEDVIKDSVEIVNDPKNNLNIQTNNFSEIDSSGILMFPLSMSEQERDGLVSSYKSMPANKYWNIIFLNSITNEFHLLSEQKMLIGNYDFKYNSGGSNININVKSKYIFYSIICDDYNNDKKLTDEDPVYLFVSDNQGKNFRQISPKNYDLQNWQFIESANKFYLTAKKDSDNNKKFETEDETATFAIDIDKETEAKEVFSEAFKNKLKVLFDRDWKRVKE